MYIFESYPNNELVEKDQGSSVVPCVVCGSPLDRAKPLPWSSGPLSDSS